MLEINERFFSERKRQEKAGKAKLGKIITKQRIKGVEENVEGKAQRWMCGNNEAQVN